MRHVPTSSYPANLSESQVPGMLSAQSEGTQIGVRRSDSCCPQPKAEKREEEGQVRRLLIHLPNCPPSHLHHPAPSPPQTSFMFTSSISSRTLHVLQVLCTLLCLWRKRKHLRSGILETRAVHLSQVWSAMNTRTYVSNPPFRTFRAGLLWTGGI